MAEIKDSDQENHIDAFINYNNYHWIGLNDLSTEGIAKMQNCSKRNAFKHKYSGVFKWSETHQEAEYTNWLPGQPDNAHSDQDCVKKSLTTAGWDDYDCEGLYYALCMMKYSQ